MDIDFAEWDPTLPFDLDAELAKVPASATVKGVIINSVTDQLRGTAATIESSTLFRDYPMHDYMQTCVETAKTLWPDDSLRDGLRRLGHGHYGAFVNTTIGRVVFGVLGSNMSAVLRNSPKGYKYTTNCSECRVLSVANGEGIVSLGGLPFADTLQVGVYEGGVRATGFEPHVASRTVDGVVHIRVRWTDPRSTS